MQPASSHSLVSFAGAKSHQLAHWPGRHSPADGDDGAAAAEGAAAEGALEPADLGSRLALLLLGDGGEADADTEEPIAGAEGAGAEEVAGQLGQPAHLHHPAQSDGLHQIAQPLPLVSPARFGVQVPLPPPLPLPPPPPPPLPPAEPLTGPTDLDDDDDAERATAEAGAAAAAVDLELLPAEPPLALDAAAGLADGELLPPTAATSLGDTTGFGDPIVAALAALLDPLLFGSPLLGLAAEGGDATPA